MTSSINSNFVFAEGASVSTSTDDEREGIELSLLTEEAKSPSVTHAAIRKLKFENWKSNWWRIHDDEDAEAKEDKTAKKLEPIGLKQYVVLGVTCVSVAGLQYIFKDEPIMKGTTGASMNAIKISYIQMSALKDTRIPQNVMRGIALTMLVSAMIFRYVPDDPYGIIPVLRTLPLTDASLAVFAKCDLNSLRLDQKVIALFRRCCNTELPKTPVKAVTILVQALAMGVLMSIPNVVGSFVATGAAVLKKANWRREVDIIWQAMDKIEDNKKRWAAIAAGIGSCVALTAGCAYAATTPLFQNPYLSWLPVAVGIVTFDVVSRTGKQMINAYELPDDCDVEEPAPTCWTRCSSALQTLGLIGTTVGISAVVGPTMIHKPGVESVATTPGIVVTACQEAGSYLKVATGKIMKSTAALAASCATLAIGTGVYLARDALGIDRYVTPGYGATVFGLASVFTTAMYLNKLLLKAPKKPKPPKNTTLDL